MLVPSAYLALPAVKTVVDCADYGKTVQPFLEQLNTLPQRILAAGVSLDAQKAVYISTNPLIFGLAFSLFLVPIFLVVSEANRNYSQVDRCWSILPTVYNAHFTLWAHMNGLPTQKLDNVLAFSTLWSIRLTFNYWRKGGYSVGSEDYRWEIVQKYINRFVMFLFNVTFISLTQSLLLFAIATPTYVLLLSSRITGEGMTTVDTIFARVLMALVVVEFFADGQQWNYQTAKKSYNKTAKVPPKFEQKDLDRGFVTSGLWRYSRHPNFAAEQTIWVVLYQWCCYETHTFVNWTFVGALSYLFLFQSSTWLTELITSGKYPEYKIYQACVGKFLPSVLGASWDDHVKSQQKQQDKAK